MDSSFVSQLIEKYQIKCDYIHRYIDVVSEIGELGKELLNVTNYGKKTFQATPEVEQEIGDCLFSLLALCTELNIKPDKALAFAIEKYEKRFQETGSISSIAK